MADQDISLGPYVILVQDLWKSYEVIEEPPTFRLTLGASEKWAAGIWIELGGWERFRAAFLEGPVSGEWEFSGFTWQRSLSQIRDPDEARSIIGERENYAARWSDDLVGFHLSFIEQ